MRCSPARSLAVAAAGALVALGLAACSGGGGAPMAGTATTLPERAPIQAEEPRMTPPPSTMAAGEGPRVESIEVVPPAACGPGDAQVVVRYATSGATTVAFAVDQASPAGGEPPPPTGEHVLAVACDGRSHTVLLVALDAEGRQAVASAVVTTTPL
jgi:hypothetical protein